MESRGWRRRPAPVRPEVHRNARVMRVSRSGVAPRAMAEGGKNETPPVRRGLGNPTGFEPATSPFVKRAVHPLSYGIKNDDWGGESVFKWPRVVLNVVSTEAPGGERRG